MQDRIVVPEPLPKARSAQPGQKKSGEARRSGQISAAAAPAGAECWLSLAAAPTFLGMAGLTAITGGGMPDMLCSAALNRSPLSGMVLMYLLMSAFHAAPWLRLMSRRRGGADRASAAPLRRAAASQGSAPFRRQLAETTP